MVDFFKKAHPDLGLYEDEMNDGDMHMHNYQDHSHYQQELRNKGSFTLPASESSPLGQTETLQCIVKWFNPIKGYGFVMPKGVNEDIFIHFSVLDVAGYQYLGPGDELACVVLQGERGRQVSQMIEVTPARHAPAPYMFGYGKPQPVGPLEETCGEVKWFNTIRGFGFVKADNGGRDIFVHASVLRRIGLQKIYPAQRVRMQVANADSGRQAWTIELIE